MTLNLRTIGRTPLSRDAMAEAIDRIVDGSLRPEQIDAFLRALAGRGETAEELAGAVDSLRRHAVALPLRNPAELCDTCGTGGDGHGTFNISTLAALAAAAAGVRIAKHGNRAATSRCGSADVLAALGVNIDAPPARVGQSIDELGFGFCFAPTFHPAMKTVAPIRKTLGIRTIFNLVGPLANPAPLAAQIVGVSQPALLRPMAEALRELGVGHALVVHGLDGLDEVTLTTDTQGLEVRHRAIAPLRIWPEALGLPRAPLEALQGGDPERNAAIAREVLAGPPSPRRSVVALNAACAIYVAGRAHSIAEGMAKAEAALESGRAKRLLEQVVELTNRPINSP